MGRSLIGSPAIHKIPAIRARNISICCAIGKGKVLMYETSETAYNSEKYHHFLANLIQNLKQDYKENFIFIMDNVRFHKSDNIKNLITTSGYKYLYLPPYSPFLNQIENMFYKCK